jgi:hypothetical protein
MRKAITVSLKSKDEIDSLAKGLGVKTTVLCRHWIIEGLKKAKAEGSVCFSAGPCIDADESMPFVKVERGGE